MICMNKLKSKSNQHNQKEQTYCHKMKAKVASYLSSNLFTGAFSCSFDITYISLPRTCPW